VELKSIPSRFVAFCRLLAVCAVAAGLGACTLESMMAPPPSQVSIAPPDDSDAGPDMSSGTSSGTSSGSVNSAIGRYSALYGVPESLIRRIIVRESDYNSTIRHGPYWGLMQIRYDTARSMGYQGAPQGLLDPDINLHYGVKYLAGAYKVAYGDPEKAVSFYASGYFYDARRRGLLNEVGLKRGK
jgi:soluble lytic murein transglycosylase-like protein